MVASVIVPDSNLSTLLTTFDLSNMDKHEHKATKRGLNPSPNQRSPDPPLRTGKWFFRPLGVYAPANRALCAPKVILVVQSWNSD